MELVGTIWEATKCLCGCVSHHAAYAFDLEDNLESLKTKWKDLKDKKVDVEREVEEVENTGRMQRKQQVNGWLQRIQLIQKEIDDITVKGDQEIQNKCMCECCPKNCVSSYKVGKKVTKLLKNVDELLTQGNSFCPDAKIAHKLPITTMEMPVDETVGMDLMVKKVWKSIKEEDVSVIGLYGMGGAGKTTLLKRINNEFDTRRPNFDVVMWVVVSKDLNLDSIMDNIRKKIGIEDRIWERYCSKDEKATEIHRVLKRKKFVLLLDDIWERVDLKIIGVPITNAKDTNFQSKVLFTTRSEDVCYKMHAQRKFKVECLTEREAFELFCMKVGEETLQSHPVIPKVARDMAAECRGLPLALVVVGSAMAGVKSLEAWEHSKNNLTNSSDVETNVFSILKFSYDRLPDEAHKKCLLYCALYPEDYEIRVLNLIDRWIGEGFLDKDTTKSIRDIRNHGESVIEKLKRSCLLESVEDDLFLSRMIKMHDVIRDMALWLLRDEGKNNRKIIVQEDALKMSQHDGETWNTVEKISVMNCVEFTLPVSNCCPNLTTLVTHNDTRESLDLSNVHYMSSLKVLELRFYSSLIIKLPAEIGSLVHLEYLSLAGEMYASEFPMELKNLRKLKYFALNVSDGDLASIPSEVIANLEQLRVLIFESTVKAESGVEREFLESVESLQHLEDLQILLRSKNGVKILFESTKLQTCVSRLYLVDVDTEIDMPLLLASMSKMKQLRIIYFSCLKFAQDSRVSNSCYLSMLQQVTVIECDTIIHLTWLKYAPLLQSVSVYGCESMEEVIKGGREEEKGRDDENINDLDQNVFSSLVELHLTKLPKLESIHNRALCFPKLRSLVIEDCPRLKKLPFDCKTVTHKLREIEGEQVWWDKLEWEDSATKNKFHSKFRVWQ